jgi:DNA primase
MKFFERYFTDTDFSTGQEEIKVLCPFHDDSNPSASVNTKKDLFHCWVCGVGYNEQQFLARINNISLSDAHKVVLKTNESTHDWIFVEKAELWANPTFLKKVEELGFKREIIDELNLGLVKDNKGRAYLGYPVFYNHILMDTRRFNLLKFDGVPKVMSNAGAETGFIIPYDMWVKSTGITYVFEGEKKMALARSLGLNAITLTGGANTRPNDFVLNGFIGKDIVICYDNDKAGREGASKLYEKIKPVAKSVRYINIGEVVQEDGEDFYEFIMKYNKTVDDFLKMPTYEFLEELDTPKKQYTPIRRALKENRLKEELLTQVLVSAEYGDVYAVPSMVEFEKIGNDDGDMLLGEKKSWFLDLNNQKQILELIEVDAKTQNVHNILKKYIGLPKEKGLNITVKEYLTIYKVKVTDTHSDDTFAIDLYTFKPMVVGNEYEIHYNIYTHPNKHQRLVSIAKEVQDISTFDDFKPNKEIFDRFRLRGSVKEHLGMLYQSAKHHIAKHLKYDLWLMSDLVFSSILEFKYDDEVIRGALDVFILGDTQVGKSETTSKLVDLYSFGHFLSLKTSTTVGLIGGSNKVEGSWLNTIGAIPRQHTRLAVLEEFSGAKPEFVKTMTDIRSSGKLRLARAAGELNVPCRLRMITISNPINDTQGNPRFLSTFPNGVIPLMELIQSAEDVARYDGFLLVEKVKERINPFSYKLESEPIPKEFYEHKIQWVATRKPADVIFSEGSDSYIWEKAEEMNAMFESNFPLFGTTTPLKLSRYSVALASVVTNTDETMTKVIVTKEIVDTIVEYLYKIYDNPIFKLKEYKIEMDSYNQLAKGDVDELENIWSRNATMLDFLANQSSTSRNNLRAISGLETDDFSKIFNTLSQYKFIRLHGESVYPTEKFRLGMSKIDKKLRSDTGKMLKDKVEKLKFKEDK